MNEREQFKLPQTEDEVFDFVGSNFNSMEWTAQGEKGERRYSLTDHDLLTSFREWEDRLTPPQASPATVAQEVHGFSREDLEAIADGLDGYERTVNVGNTTGEGDELLESTTAAASRFIRAALTTAQPAPQEAQPVAFELRGVAEVLAEGNGFWRSCSGCHELNEGHPIGAFSSALKCHLGLGCDECGGIGAIWDDTDYDEMAKFMAGEEDAAPQPARAGVVDLSDEALARVAASWGYTLEEAAGHLDLLNEVIAAMSATTGEKGKA